MALDRTHLTVTVLAIAFSTIVASSTFAQNPFSFVSQINGVSNGNCASAYPSGSDSPCNSLEVALPKTLDGGTIICVDAGNHRDLFDGLFTGIVVLPITTGLTIDCKAGGGGTDTTGILINAPGKQVSLRNLTINPALTRSGNDPAIKIVAAASVDMDNVVITGANNAGIYDQRSTLNAKLSIRNSIIAGHSGPGIVIVPQGSGTISATLDNVSVRDTSYGLAVGARGRAQVNRSVFAQNAVAGIEADPGGIIEISDTLVSNNATGVIASTGSSITIADSGINSNNIAISGATRSYGNNRFFANASSIGTLPTPAGSPSSENGLR